MRIHIAAVATAALLLALTAPGQASASSLGAAPAGRVPVVAADTVTLVTGEQVRIAPGSDGRPVVTVARSAHAGIQGSSSTVRMGQDTYVIPTIARPYLGRYLDLGLFDVSALARAGASARLPVRLTYSGSAAPALPGVTITAASTGVARGFVTPSSARAFGAALARQYTADAARGWPKQSALFGGLGQLTADVAPAGGGVVPAFPMRTLIINVLDLSGGPLQFGVVQLSSVDDASKFFGFALVVDGQARVSVPVGTYAGLGEIDTFDVHTLTGTISIVPFDSYVVRASTSTQTLTLDGRTARSKLSVRTPRPADTVAETWEWDRTDATGMGGVQSAFQVPAGLDIYTAPVAAPAPSLGSLSSVTSWALAGSPAWGLPYTYDLAFPARGVPADQSHLVRAADVATVDARYFSDIPKHQGVFGRFAVLPSQFFSGGPLTPLDLPGRRTEYVLALAAGSWGAVLLPNADSTTDPFAGAISDGPRIARAGTATTVDWARGPSVPGVPFATDGYPAGVFLCPVCRTADTLEMFLFPATDTTPGHLVEVSLPTDGTHVARFRVYRDGVLLFDQPDTAGAVLPVHPGSATYRIVDEVDRVPSGAVQSSATSTDLTFRSAAGTGGPMPATWFCDLGPACSVPALLQAAVRLPVGLAGNVPVGTATIGLTLGHIQGAPTVSITGGTVEVRIGHAGWRTLPGTALGAGRFQFVLTTTAAQTGAGVDLRVSGTDAAGGRIVQTTTRAFVVSS